MAAQSTARRSAEAAQVIVLFGATGDLAARKLLPGFYHLAEVGLMPEDYRLIGSSPVELTEETFLAHAKNVIEQFGSSPLTEEGWSSFSSKLSYVPSSAEHMESLAAKVAEGHAALGEESHSLYYLSIPPMAMDAMVTALGAAKMNGPEARVVLEKPFGTDRASAVALNALLHTVFEERQIYRIDHFLGKEDVQNVLAVRFSNRLFEPMWSGEHLERVEIDVPETLGVEDRVGFYEETGAFRDMVVTHLFQVLGFLAMEPPAAFTAEALRQARDEVFKAMEPVEPSRAVRGQYEGYRQLPGVDPTSDTETLVALEVKVDTPRWRGVPFFLRTGKQMAEGRRTITLTLKEPELEIFELEHDTGPNQMVFEIGEPGSISIFFRRKEPGADMLLGRGDIAFEYAVGDEVAKELEAYELLLHDVMRGDATLFNSAEGIERLWEVAGPLLADPPAVQLYAAGSWGPPEAAALPGSASWYLPEGDDER